jgi:hypothetical protein
MRLHPGSGFGTPLAVGQAADQLKQFCRMLHFEPGDRFSGLVSHFLDFWSEGEFSGA